MADVYGRQTFIITAEVYKLRVCSSFILYHDVAISVNILHKKSLGSLLLIWVKIDKEEWHFIQVSERKKKVSDEEKPEIIARIRAKMCKFSGLNLTKVSTALVFWRNRKKFIS